MFVTRRVLAPHRRQLGLDTVSVSYGKRRTVCGFWAVPYEALTRSYTAVFCTAVRRMAAVRVEIDQTGDLTAVVSRLVLPGTGETLETRSRGKPTHLEVPYDGRIRALSRTVWRWDS